MKPIKLLIKVLTYLWIIYPITRSILRGLLGYKFGSAIAMIAILIIIYQLESKKILDKIIDRLLENISKNSKQNNSTLGVASKSIIGAIADKDSFTTTLCPNCGAKVDLINGTGTCKSCDSVVTQ